MNLKKEKKKGPSEKQMKSERVKEQNLVLCPKRNLWIKVRTEVVRNIYLELDIGCMFSIE